MWFVLDCWWFAILYFCLKVRVAWLFGCFVAFMGWVCWLGLFCRFGCIVWIGVLG